jgi:type IV fimbrial biogenesis protein FimT
VLGKEAGGGDDPIRIVGFRQGQTVVPGKIQTMPSVLMTHLRARCRACGFTLVELMVTLAVAAILAMIAVPSFKRVLVSTNLSDINNAVAGDLQYARTEAVSRQVSIAVAQSGGSWQNGWTVNIPPASSTGTATVLRRHPAVSDQYAVSGPAAGVNYSAQGTPSASTCFTFSEADGHNSTPRYLQISASGSLQQITSATTPTGCPAPSP